MATRRISGDPNRNYGYSSRSEGWDRIQGYGHPNSYTEPYRTDEYGRGGYPDYPEAGYEYDREGEGGIYGPPYRNWSAVEAAREAGRRDPRNAGYAGAYGPWRPDLPTGRGYWEDRSLYVANEGRVNDAGPFGYQVRLAGSGPHAGRGPRNYRRSDERIR